MQLAGIIVVSACDVGKIIGNRMNGFPMKACNDKWIWYEIGGGDGYALDVEFEHEEASTLIGTKSFVLVPHIKNGVLRHFNLRVYDENGRLTMVYVIERVH